MCESICNPVPHVHQVSSGSSVVPVIGIVAIAGALVVPAVLSVLGLVLIIVQAIIIGLITSAVIVVVGLILREFIAEWICNWGLARHNRQMYAQLAQRPVYEITNVQRAELVRPVHRAIEPVRVTPTPMAHIREMASKS